MERELSGWRRPQVARRHFEQKFKKMEERSKSDHENKPSQEEGYQNDIFLQLQDVISSLETCVFSWRNPSIEKSKNGSVATQLGPLVSSDAMSPFVLHGLSQEFPGMFPNEDPKELESEIKRYQENNASLRVKLRVTDKELDRSRSTLRLFMDEKEKLQIKLNRLQDMLQDHGHSPPTSPISPFSEELCDGASESQSPTEIHISQKPVTALQSVIQYVHSLPGTQLAQTSAIHPNTMECEMKWLKGHLERVKELNDQLSKTLEECKTDSEKLSMHLGKLESTCTALRLALQASEKCLKTYSILLALAEAKEEILMSQVPSGDLLNLGWGLLPKDLEIKTKLFMMEVRKTFRREGHNTESELRKKADNAISRPYAPWLSEEDEQMLKDYIQSLKWDLSSITVLEHSALDISYEKEVTHCAEMIKAKVADAIKVSLEASARLLEKPARVQIVQEMTDIKKGLSELKACLQLLQTEKRALELQCLTQPEHEKAYMLIRDNLQVEHNDWIKKEKDSGSNRDEQTTGCERASFSQGKKLLLSPGKKQLLHTLKQSSEIKVRVESLTSELEKLAGKARAQNAQSAQMIKDFFKAHRNLFLTYKNACRKYQDQQHRLESQAALISQRQQQQIQKLMEDIQCLQRKKIEREAGETSL
ncbi:harmonin-binding protein USHBP1 isoform X2 [Hyperolius riggenbachi]|uniref:harmonin-binding protein USHBP1 isoform X2 n=1 Tax=Hyperolius riggenbachi TaxID=752182 RepID=UPI0035A3C87D